MLRQNWKRRLCRRVGWVAGQRSVGRTVALGLKPVGPSGITNLGLDHAGVGPEGCLCAPDRSADQKERPQSPSARSVAVSVPGGASGSAR